ncbi:MAG TPA: STN domain-containing protein, partial [Rhizomicrobium sp.]|nr:STN domain-containing protein [Rhizomicrobium sp.]
MSNTTQRALLGSVCLSLFAGAAYATSVDIPGGDLKSALHAYSVQTGVQVLFLGETMRNTQTRGVKGAISAEDALARVLAGTGFVAQREGDAVVITQPAIPVEDIHLAQLRSAASPVETVTVTSSKLGGQDVQTVPIAIT